MTVSISNPGPYTCIDNAIGANTDILHGNQIEVGDVTCGGQTGGADGTCSTQGGHAKFIETDFEDSYNCVQHGNFTPGQSDSFRASRIYATPTTNLVYAGYVDGTEYESAYMTTTSSNKLYVFGWAESSTNGTSTCGASNHDNGSYDNVQRYDYSNNAMYALNTVSNGYFNTGCFTISNYNSDDHFQASLN